MTPDGPVQGAPPQLSADGAWWWDGRQWVPTSSRSRHDGLAIGSLISSLVWVFGLGSVAAIVLGHLSRGKAAREGRPKSGMALAGLIIGYVGTALLLVGILAAIAIPVFLNQREKSVLSALKSDLRTVAILEEEYYTEHDTYTGSVDHLAGARAVHEGVSVTVLSADVNGYCLQATNVSESDYYWYDSLHGGLTDEPCGQGVGT